MKIVSWNVNGIRAVVRKGNWDWFTKTQPDILCVQETKAHPDQLAPEVRNPKGYFSYFDHSKGRKGYSGVAIFSKSKPEKVEDKMGIPEFDQEGRLLIAYFKEFVLLNVYFPNGGGPIERLKYKLAFYEHFLKLIDKLHKKYKKIIVCGDINVAHAEIDLARPKENVTHVGFLPEERAWFSKVLEHGYIDVFRHFYPTKTGAYTYWDMKSFARDRNVGWRIDYFLVSPETLESIKSIKIEDDVFGSDHCPVELVVNL